MKRATIASAICLATTVTLLATTKVPFMKAGTLVPETAVAGISLSLDKYYSFVNNQNSNLSVAAARSIAPLSEGEAIPAMVDEINQEGTPAEEGTPIDETQENDASSQENAEVKEEKEPEVSEYANTGISVADNYVNIRSEANTESEVLGKLYKGSAATILETEGEWVKIKSGKVKGYIKSEFLAIGFSAEELVDKYGTKIATVNTTTLKVREEKGLDSIVLTLVPLGEEFQIVKEYKEWVKIMVDDQTEGYVSKEYVDIKVEFEQAISVEEEQAKIRAEEEARIAEQEAQERLRAEEERRKQQAANKPSNNGSSSSSSSSSNNSSSSNSSSSSSNDQTTSSGSGNGSSIASFAKKFIGNRYVYGGTSLTSGVDCSGFTQAVYRNFGYSIPRTSGQQSGAGSSVGLGSVVPGDLIFYSSNGVINHVAIYIGGGQVVHASNPRSGIKISNMYYRTPAKARRIIN